MALPFRLALSWDKGQPSIHILRLRHRLRLTQPPGSSHLGTHALGPGHLCPTGPARSACAVAVSAPSLCFSPSVVSPEALKSYSKTAGPCLLNTSAGVCPEPEHAPAPLRSNGQTQGSSDQSAARPILQLSQRGLSFTTASPPSVKNRIEGPAHAGNLELYFKTVSQAFVSRDTDISEEPKAPLRRWLGFVSSAPPAQGEACRPGAYLGT